jgi:hypothetical protein
MATHMPSNKMGDFIFSLDEKNDKAEIHNKKCDFPEGYNHHP